MNYLLVLVFIGSFFGFPVEAQAEKSVNLLDADDAISIRSVECIRGDKRSGTIYKGLIENISNYGTYSAKMKVSFNYRKDVEGFRKWDSQTKFFKLKPGQKRYFKFVSRIAPDSFEMRCSRETTMKFIDSTYKI